MGGLRDDLVNKNKFCSCKGLGFGSQRSYMAAHRYLYTFRRANALFSPLKAADTCAHNIHTHKHTYMSKNKINLFFKSGVKGLENDSAAKHACFCRGHRLDSQNPPTCGSQPSITLIPGLRCPLLTSTWTRQTCSKKT